MQNEPQPEAEPVASFPLSATQERCWFLDRMRPGNPSLNVPFRWEVRGPVEPAEIERAFRLVIERHEILRTRLVERGGAPVQEVMASAPFRLDQVDIRALPEEERAARVERIAHGETQRPFDLSLPGAIRACHVRVAPERAYLLITVHQSCFDGYSIGVLGREIAEALRAFEAGRAAPDLPELELQYGDYALWQRELFESGAIEEDRDWWTERLAGAPYFEIPPDRPRPPKRGTEARQHHRQMPDGFGERLEETARRLEASPFAVGAAVVSACLHRITGETDILFGTQVAGRADTMLDDLIGVFINNLVLRMEADGARSLADQVAVARRAVEGALAHQALPFNRLVEAVNPVRDASRTPLISCNYTLQHVFMSGQSGERFELVSAPAHSAGAIYDLSFVLVGRETGWRLNVEYATDLFEARTAEGIAALIEDAFEAAFSDPSAPIGALPLPEALRGRDTPPDAPGLLEAALRALPEVADVAAVPNGAAPFAFVVPSADAQVPLERLPEHLAARLAEGDAAPAHSGMSILMALPRGADGALDRARLRIPAPAPARAPAPAPPSRVTETLRAIWRDVLGRAEIPPEASFFDLGGHSLLVVRMLSRLRSELGIEADVATVYENPSLRALAEAIAGEASPATGEPTLPAAADEEDWRILRLKAGGAGLPIIGVNNASTVLAAAQAPGHERPAICIRLTDGAGGGIHGQDLSWAEIAERYADVAEAARPEGPILLFGICVHGNLAVEIARILSARGREIAGVVLKDVWETGFTERMKADRGARWRERWAALRNRIRMWREGLISLDAVLGSYRIVRATGVLQLAVRLGLIERVRSSDLEQEQEAFNLWLAAARDAHRSEPTDVPILHMVTRITPQGRGFPPSIGWEDAATGRLETRRVEDIMVWRDRRIGTADLARAISEFLGEAGQPS